MAVNMKRIIANALLSLSEEKPLRKITINDIIQKSGTARQTFYNHFSDKNDLIYWIYLHTLAGEHRLVETKGYYYYLVNLFYEAQKISNFLSQACKLTGQNCLSDTLYHQNYNYYRKYITEHYGDEALTYEVDYALQFNAAGASYVYMKWLLNGAPDPVEKQALLTLRCMPDIIRSFLPLGISEEELNQPLAFLISSTSTGITSKRFPTTP